MSSATEQPQPFANGNKKAVHVKWAGKTIALGTFAAAEADEKCARAKALTRAWRSSMRPKPTRDWVMNELERLGVRVVSGRLGRKAGEDGDEESESGDKKVNVTSQTGIGAPAERRNSLGWGGDAELSALISKRNSLGLSGIMSDRRGSLGSLGPVLGMDGMDLGHRQMGSGNSVAGFDAGFQQEQQRRSSSLGLGSLSGGNLGNMGMSVNPNQHYEMLKLHHMNLLNEIQETTLMMNLYQQQQLQHQVGSDMSGNDAQMALLLQQQQNNQNSMDAMFGANAAQRLNGGLSGPQAQMQMQLLQHQMQNSSAPLGNEGTSGTKRKGGKKGAKGPSAKAVKQEDGNGKS